MVGQQGVALVVPGGFDAYARVLHPLRDGLRWAEVAPSFLERGASRYDYPFPDPVSAVEGDLGDSGVEALLGPLEAATSRPDLCHYGLWNGWGWLHPGARTTLVALDRPGGLFARWRSRRVVARARREQDARDAVIYEFARRCPVKPWWGGREVLLFDGPLHAVDAIGCNLSGRGRLDRQSPQWWWPEDRAWFVATEIDYPWTYVGGSYDLINGLHKQGGIDVVTVDHADPW